MREPWLPSCVWQGSTKRQMSPANSDGSSDEKFSSLTLSLPFDFDLEQQPLSSSPLDCDSVLNCRRFSLAEKIRSPPNSASSPVSEILRLLSDDSTADERISFLRLLVSALPACHIPFGSVSMHFHRCCEIFGWGKAECFFASNAVFFTTPVGSSYVHAPVGFDFAKIDLYEAILAKFYGGGFHRLEQVHRLLSKIHSLPELYPAWLRVPSFGALCVAVSPAFGGGWLECLVGWVLGCGFGALLLLVPYLPALSATFDFWSSALIGAGCRLAMEIVVRLFRCSDGIHGRLINFYAVCLPVVIWILPGFSQIAAFTDYLLGNRALGVAAVFSSLFCAFSIGLGLFFGFYIFAWWEAPLIAPEPNPCRNLQLENYYRATGVYGASYNYWILLSVPAAAFFIALNFNATPRQCFPIVVVATACFAVYFLLMQLTTTPRRIGFLDFDLLGVASSFGAAEVEQLPGSVHVPEACSSLVAAFTASVLGCIWSRLTGYHALPVIYGSIVMLAPGGWGANAAFNALRMNLSLAGYQMVNMLLISLSLATGVLLGKAITRYSR